MGWAEYRRYDAGREPDIVAWVARFGGKTELVEGPERYLIVNGKRANPGDWVACISRGEFDVLKKRSE